MAGLITYIFARVATAAFRKGIGKGKVIILDEIKGNDMILDEIEELNACKGKERDDANKADEDDAWCWCPALGWMREIERQRQCDELNKREAPNAK